MLLFYTLLMSIDYLMNSITVVGYKSETLSLDDVIISGFEDTFKDDPLLDYFRTHIDRVLRFSEENNSSIAFYFDFEQQSIFDTEITLTGIDNNHF